MILKVFIILQTHLITNKEVDEDVYNAIVNPESKYQAFVSRIENTIIGVFVTSKDVNLTYYK
jgi:hypothetical protein